MMHARSYCLSRVTGAAAEYRPGIAEAREIVRALDEG
jgi:hypothetical protein